MARKSKSSVPAQASEGASRRSNPQFSKLRWINPYLDQTDVEWLKANHLDIAVVILDFLDGLPETCNLSAKYDNKTDRWLATVIYSSDDPTYSDTAVSIRGATRSDALYALAYVVVEKYADGLPEGDAAPTGRWG